MIRRQARQRRDYLYRRAQAQLAAETATKRAALKAALASGKPLPAGLAADKALLANHKYDESQRDAHDDSGVKRPANPDTPGSALALSDAAFVDDEWAHLSGLADPRVLVTTSRHPSTRLGVFAKEMRLLLAPTAVRLNRGTLVLGEMVGAARTAGLTDTILLHEHRGVPTALTLSHLPHGPTLSFSLHAVALRHDLPTPARGTVSEAAPHLIFDGFTTPLGRRVARALAHLFPPRDPVGPHTPAPKLGHRIVTFAVQDDNITLRHHVWVRTGPSAVELAEVGPRLTLRLFEIRGGTLEARDADVEWRWNQFTRTSRKRTYL